MRTNLPKEMDFVHEARNAERARADFIDTRTSMYIPEVITASKRVLIMEFIEGGRVDDLQYLAKHNIDRNKVSVELSRIFSQMVFVHGWFHADPHPGKPWLFSVHRFSAARLILRGEVTSSSVLPLQAPSHRTTLKSCSWTMDCTSIWTLNSG